MPQVAFLCADKNEVLVQQLREARAREAAVVNRDLNLKRQVDKDSV